MDIQKMGCIISICGNSDEMTKLKQEEMDAIPDVIPHSSSNRDVVPLLESQVGKEFAHLNFSDSSSSIEIDMAKIEQLIKQETLTDEENYSDIDKEFKENIEDDGDSDPRGSQ